MIILFSFTSANDALAIALRMLNRRKGIFRESQPFKALLKNRAPLKTLFLLVSTADMAWYFNSLRNRNSQLWCCVDTFWVFKRSIWMRGHKNLACDHTRLEPFTQLRSDALQLTRTDITPLGNNSRRIMAIKWNKWNKMEWNLKNNEAIYMEYNGIDQTKMVPMI